MGTHDYEYDAPHSPGSQVHQEKPVVREHSTYMTDREAQKVCQLFADGLSSGVGYARILDFMTRQGLDSKMIDRLRHAVLELGDRLGEAFARFGILNASARKLILVGEEQGSLPEVFDEQAVIFGNRYKRKKQFLFALVEPAIFICLGLFYFLNILNKVVDATFAADTWDIVGDEALKSTIQSLIFFTVGGGAAYFWLNLPVDSSMRDLFGRVFYRIPVVSKASRLYSVANFCRYLKQSIRSGMDIYVSINLAAEASNSPWFMESVDDAFDVLDAGYPLDHALSQMKGIPDEVVDHIAIGEETGRLEERLTFLAEKFEEESDEAFERLMKALIYVLRFIFIIFIFVFAIFAGVLELGFNLDM